MRTWESFEDLSVRMSLDNNVTPRSEFWVALPFRGDTDWWTVQLGRHPDERISSGPYVLLSSVRNRTLSAKAKAGLIGSRTRTFPNAKARLSEPLYSIDESEGWPKSYSGDNRVVSPKSPYRRRGFLHRRRLFLSWVGSTIQGWGSSPIKRDVSWVHNAVRQLV